MSAVPDSKPVAVSVLEYWLGVPYNSDNLLDYNASKIQLWFRADPVTDEDIKKRFLDDIRKVGNGDYDAWLEGPAKDAVAGIILMDQFTRNVYRGSAQMYSLDERALLWTNTLMESGRDKGLRFVERMWVYLPLMHSEKLEEQQRCLEAFTTLQQEAAALPGGPELAALFGHNVLYAKKHLEVVAKWGRFPHRNALLGRANTPEEEQGLKDGSIAKF